MGQMRHVFSLANCMALGMAVSVCTSHSPDRNISETIALDCPGSQTMYCILITFVSCSNVSMLIL